MPVFSDGQKISAALAWDRMIQSVPASYVVWKDGSTYRAECLLKGGTDYSGTDAATVIQNTLDEADGVVFIKSGSYDIDTTIALKSNAILLGEGINTVLNNKMVHDWDYVFSIGSSVSDVVIRNLKITSTGETGAINCYGSNVLFDSLTIENMYNGLVIQEEVSSIVVQNCFFTSNLASGNPCMLHIYGSDVVISNNIFKDIAYKALRVFKGNNINILSNVFVDAGGKIYEAPIDVWSSEGNTSGVVIDGNLIRFTTNPLNVQNGIIISGELSDAYSTSEIVVCDNVIDGGGFANLNIGIYLHGYSSSVLNVKNVQVTGNVIKNLSTGFGIANSDTAMFIGNTLYNVTNAVSKDAPSTNITFKRNIGYVTENGGTATISNGNTSIAVNHGCDYTPSAEDIDVHPIESLGSASFWWVDTITSTQFTIHVNADPGQDVDFKWSVRRI